MLTRAELYDYLNSLSRVLNETLNDPNSPVGVLLTSHKHALALSYTPNKGWLFRDSNQPLDIDSKPKTTWELVDAILGGFKIFLPYVEFTPFVAFNTRLILTEHHKTQAHLEKLKLVWSSNASIKALAKRQSRDNVTLAFIAAQNGRVDVIKALAKEGADLNQAVVDGVNVITLVFIAAQNGHVDVIKALVDAGADLNRAAVKGATPAFMAAQEGYANVIEVLADAGADLNQAMVDGATPAFVAAQQGHAKVIDVLANKGADLDKATVKGGTPTFIAAQQGHLDVIKLLLKNNARVDIPFESTVEQLIIFADNAAQRLQRPQISQRMKTFLETQQATLVKVLPYDIAIIMGHDDIAQVIKEHCQQAQLVHINNKSSLFSTAKNLVQSLKTGNIKEEALYLTI
ncbi:ankyrin repeat domain-containing protein [Legionella sp. D16C41]|uniref:ankyrin repeat domain-containing protein n=1 Tax=Legionella sp. D16C41 TaxID=3402688 RepID=UPI003AF980B7